MARPRRRVEIVLTKIVLSSAEVEALWKRYRRWPNSKALNMLVTHYLPIAKFTAERLAKRLPNEVDVNDLFQNGVGHPADDRAATGLFKAIAKFNPKRSRFTTYAALCVRGAILDGLRDQDWTPRLVRARVRKVDQARIHLAHRLGRDATDDEVRKYLGLTVKDWKFLVNDARSIGTTSLSKTRFETDTGKSVCDNDLLEPRVGSRHHEEVDNRDLCERITRGLNPNEKFIVASYYGDQSMTMKQIAACLGLTESRVSQMHMALTKRLREQHKDTYERTLQ